MFYRYDALRHFQHAQVMKETLTPDIVERDYIQYQALGAAIKSGQTRVVLLDEIDKAPRDLPNNLLAALDKLEFNVPETGDPSAFFFQSKTRKPPDHHHDLQLGKRPARSVPAPGGFFRHQIPGEADLLEILRDKLEDFKKLDAEKVIGLFEKIRKAEFGVLEQKTGHRRTAALGQFAAQTRRGYRSTLGSPRIGEDQKMTARAFFFRTGENQKRS